MKQKNKPAEIEKSSKPLSDNPCPVTDKMVEIMEDTVVNLTLVMMFDLLGTLVETFNEIFNNAVKEVKNDETKK